MKTFVRTLLFIFAITICGVYQVVAQWVQTSGPGGGVVNCVSMAGSDMYAGTNGGVFRSTDAGLTWAPTGKELLNKGVFSIASTDSFVFAGTDNGVYRSADGGAHWLASNSGMNTLDAVTMFADRARSLLFAGTLLNGLFLSPDEGATWTQAAGIPTDQSVWSITSAGSFLFAGADHDVYRSSDDGASWAPVNSGLQYVYALVRDGVNIYAGTGIHVYYSSNNGVDWTPAKNGLPFATVRALAIEGSTLYAGDDGRLYQSTNGGADWAAVPGYGGGEVNTLLVHDSVLIAGSGKGISRSTDHASTWSCSNEGLARTYVNVLCAVGDDLYAGTSGNGVLRSTDRGDHWTPDTSGMTSQNVSSLAMLNGKLFAGTQSGIFRSPDSGASWSSVNNGLAANELFRSLAVSRDGSGKLFAGGSRQGVYLSTDEGEHWINGSSAIKKIFSIEFIGTTIFAGTYDRGVFRSIDDGLNWVEVNNGLTYKETWCLAVMGAQLFTATDGSGIFRTNNGGALWEKMNSGISDERMESLTATSTILLAGTHTGNLYLSTNAGVSWKSAGDGLPSRAILALAVSGTTAYAGIYGYGVWKRDLADLLMDVERLPTDAPSHFTLSQNYPNPFNPSTTIEFSVPQSGFVSLKIFDVFGKVVGTLVHEEMQPGSYKTTWDASELAGGVYFYRVEAGGFSEMKKLVLVK